MWEDMCLNKMGRKQVRRVKTGAMMIRVERDIWEVLFLMRRGEMSVGTRMEGDVSKLEEDIL